MNIFIARLATLMAMLALTATAHAAAIFLTGHDPDFHAYVGGNSAGAQDINKAAIGFVTSSTNNSFTAGGVNKFLFVEGNISPPPGHVDGLNGIIASGYTQGTDFDVASAATLNTALNGIGSIYNAIVVASDFGGILTQAELDILNARSADIISFLNAGGGIYAMAESDSGAGLTPNGGFFGFLPFVVSSAQKNQSEVGNTLTAFGSSLGLTAADINGNASHNVFLNTGGLNVVDFDATGQILSIAGVVAEVPTSVPEPASIALLGIGLLGFGFSRRRKPH